MAAVACGDDSSAVVPIRATSGHATIRPAQNPTAPTFQAVEGTRVPEGTASTLIDGASVSFGGFQILGFVRVDGDGDRDLDLILALSSDVELAVAYARRDDERFTQSILGRVPRRPECIIADATLRVLAPDLGVVEQRMTCTGSPAVDISPVTLGAVARTPERIHVQMPTGDPFIAALTVVPLANDADHDGVSDLYLGLSITAHGVARAETETLVMQNVASGLVPDFAAIGARVALLERSGTRSLTSSPARALRDASRAAALALVLCPDAGATAITLGGNVNGSCRLGTRHVRALATWASAWTGLRRVDDAAALLFALDARALGLDAESATRIGSALARSPDRLSPPYVSYIVPQLANATKVAFEADGSLLVHASTDTRMRLSDAPTLEPIAPEDGAFARAEARASGSPPQSPRYLRFGDSLVLRRGEHARIVGLFRVDGGASTSLVIDDAQTHIACVAAGLVRVAQLPP